MKIASYVPQVCCDGHRLPSAQLHGGKEALPPDFLLLLLLLLLPSGLPAFGETDCDITGTGSDGADPPALAFRVPLALFLTRPTRAFA